MFLKVLWFAHMLPCVCTTLQHPLVAVPSATKTIPVFVYFCGSISIGNKPLCPFCLCFVHANTTPANFGPVMDGHTLGGAVANLMAMTLRCQLASMSMSSGFSADRTLLHLSGAVPPATGGEPPPSSLPPAAPAPAWPQEPPPLPP